MSPNEIEMPHCMSQGGFVRVNWKEMVMAAGVVSKEFADADFCEDYLLDYKINGNGYPRW